jgi:hypothetical protein
MVPDILETDIDLEAKEALMDVTDGNFCIKQRILLQYKTQCRQLLTQWM